MTDQTYNQLSTITLKAQEISEYLRQKREDFGDNAISGDVYDHITEELTQIKRLAVEVHEIAHLFQSRLQSRARINALKKSISETQDDVQRAALQSDLEKILRDDKAEHDHLTAILYGEE